MTSSMPISSVVFERYAGALIDLAEEGKAVSAVQKDLRDMKAMIESSEDLQSLVFSPLVSKDKQASAIAALSKKAKFKPLTVNFLNVLVENRRLNALFGVVDAFDKIVAQRSGQVEVVVETAEKMSAAQKKGVKEKISKALNVDVDIQDKVVPEIIGGMVVTIGSYMIDDSVRRKIERLDVALKSYSNQNTVNLKEVV